MQADATVKKISSIDIAKNIDNIDYIYRIMPNRKLNLVLYGCTASQTAKTKLRTSKTLKDLFIIFYEQLHA